MTIKTVQFVKAGELFSGFPEVAQMLSEAAPFTWGDSKHTLVTKDDIEATLFQCCVDDDNRPYIQTQEVIQRVRAIPTGILIDLEN